MTPNDPTAAANVAADPADPASQQSSSDPTQDSSADSSSQSSGGSSSASAGSSSSGDQPQDASGSASSSSAGTSSGASDSSGQSPPPRADRHIIPPRVSRHVLYFHDQKADEQAAIIAFVNDDETLNLAVFAIDGRAYHRRNVVLVQPDDEPPAKGEFCTWMPWQIGQARGAQSPGAPGA